jgi:hypothetical protein
MPIVESATSYTSSVRFLGLPLVHIARGSRFGGPRSRGVAIGWIAIGDVAFGLVAIGGVAIGVIGIGGAAVGAVSIGGLALGVASIGGVAAGVLAVGGVALGWSAAIGGVAVAREFAMGGVGVARHMNDSSATAYLDTQMFFRVASWLMYHSITLAFLPMMVMFLLVLARILRGKSSS